MIPSNIYLVSNLIKNANNKIDRIKIKKIYEKRTFI
jgi:acyl-coenzyme A synthetase/AMP-(fatty) acid ligase